MTWSTSSDQVLAEVFARLPAGATDKERDLAIREAYPFGQRKYFPYKAWLARVRAWKAAKAIGRAQPHDAPGKPKRLRDNATLKLEL